MAHHTVAVAGMLVETVQGAQPTMDHGGIHHPRLALHFVADPSDSKIRFLERRNLFIVASHQSPCSNWHRISNHIWNTVIIIDPTNFGTAGL